MPVNPADLQVMIDTLNSEFKGDAAFNRLEQAVYHLTTAQMAVQALYTESQNLVDSGLPDIYRSNPV